MTCGVTKPYAEKSLNPQVAVCDLEGPHDMHYDSEQLMQWVNARPGVVGRDAG